MRDESAFDGAEFLGLARGTRRDPYRLRLLAQHLEGDEQAVALLPIAGGTLVVTDRRLVEFRAHLEVDGAWNVREFAGYAISREVPLSAVTGVCHLTARRPPAHRSPVEDVLRVETSQGSEEFVLSLGPDVVVPSGDVSVVMGFVKRNSPSRDPDA